MAVLQFGFCRNVWCVTDVGYSRHANRFDDSSQTTARPVFKVRLSQPRMVRVRKGRLAEGILFEEEMRSKVVDW